MPSPYLWIVIASGVLSFLTGGGVGMNDLANAFGTTYGARIMKLWQIVLLASICEFVGAVALGAEVTSTISNGIANPQSFADEPYILMYGMMCALAAAFMWLMFATLMELPVSSTHSIAGAIMGFVMVYGGPKAVSFAKRIDTFPFVAGVAPIIASWFISPGFSGVAAATLYGTVRCIVLRADKPVRRAMYFLPVIVGITFFLESFFVLYKGAKARLHWSAGKAAWVSAIVGCCASIVTTALLPFLSRRVRWLWERRQRDGMSAAEAPGCVKESPEPVPETLVREPAMCPMTSPPPESGADGGAGAGAGAGAEHGAAADAPGGGCLGTKSISAYMVDEGKHSTEMYDSRVEYVFRYLQVFTAVCASFAHGANDVSNAVGPFAAIYSIYENKAVMARNDMPIWILCLGGAGIVCGLATLGVRIMRLLGERITRITPSRGFAAELSAALVVSLASAYGIPVSSTHCITGAVVAIRILDNGFCSVPWLLVGKMYAGWMFTLVITGLISAALFAQGVYAPAVSSG